MNTDQLKDITNIEALRIAEDVAVENLRAVRQRIDELTAQRLPDELLLIKYASDMFSALQLVEEADYASSQPYSMRGMCTPDNPFGQSTIKMPDGRLLDRHEMRSQASEAVQSVISKVCG